MVLKFCKAYKLCGLLCGRSGDKGTLESLCGPRSRNITYRDLLDNRLMVPEWCRISTLELPRCEMNGQDAENLAGVLAQCAALAQLNLRYNGTRAAGAGSLAGVLGSAQRWLTSCSETIGPELSGKRGFELRGVVKPQGLTTPIKLHILVYGDVSRRPGRGR